MSAAPGIGLQRADGSLIVVRDRLTIGRSDENDLRIDHDRVSRLQSVVIFEKGKLWIEDLKSSNGTRVNQRVITSRTELKDGDEIQIGPETLRVRLERAAPEARTVMAGPGGTMLEQAEPPSEFLQVLGGARYNLGRPLTLGRDADNAIVLSSDSLVSAHHARIERQGDRLVLADLASSNGTRLNGRRIQGPKVLRHRDRIQVGKTTLVVTSAANSVAARSHMPLLLAGAAVVILLVVGVALFGRHGYSPAKQAGIAAAPPMAPARTEEQLERDALRAMVQVATQQGTGSGSLISNDGLVLTNAHVVNGRDASGRVIGFFKVVEVRLNRTTPGERPNETYVADVMNVSQTFDLALLKIRAGKGNEPAAQGAPFPAVPLGNSDSLSIGSSIAVLGYPGIGGDYPTLTRGTMSGFKPDDENGIDHGWIKTDTEINWGNSGGMAVNRLGQLIGIPTQLAPALTQSNTPIMAGKLGLLRPINVARMFLSGWVDNRVSSTPQ